MNNTLEKKSEKIINSIKGTAEKSKETIREIIASNNKNIDEALNANKKIVNSIKEKLDQQELEDTVTDTMKGSFKKSVELAEDALDSIINSYVRQMEMNVDFNTKLVDAIKESSNDRSEKLLDLIHENFEASHQLSVRNTKEILDFYNKHTNLAVNFNEKFGDSINTQIDSLYTIQNKGLNKFTTWASEWWKHDVEENRVRA